MVGIGARPSAQELADVEQKANEVIKGLMDPIAQYVEEKSEKLRKQMNSLGDAEFTALFIAVTKAREDRLVSLMVRFPFLREAAIRRVGK